MKRFLTLLLVLAPVSAHADKIFNTGGGATWDCAKDGDVTINTSNGKYTFTGSCKDITVNGAKLTVTIDEVDDITINGAKNTVTINAANEISVNGTDNTVTYKKGARNAAPEVRNLGNNNSIKLAAAATATTATAPAPASGTATATTPAAPADATVLDCSKKKTVSIAKGKGSYKITGTCDKVAIAGGDNKVVIAATKNLSITGSNNEVTVDKSDKIAAMGSNNKVVFGGGLTGARPKTATTGKGNTIVASGAATIGPTAMPSTVKTGAIAPVSGTIDCAKTPNHTISDNDGSYLFKGACERITVDGNNASLKVASAKAIVLNGNNNSVDVTAADLVSTPGNDNNVRWTKGISGAKAKIANVGNGNQIVQTR